MSEHTPGPWAIADGKSNVEWRNFAIRPAVSVRKAQSPIATVPKTDVGEANARLIAAAPELLEVLQVALHLIDRGAEACLEDFTDDPVQGKEIHAFCQRVADTARAVIAKATGAVS